MSLFKAKVYSDGQGALVCLHQDVQKERRELAKRLRDQAEAVLNGSGSNAERYLAHKALMKLVEELGG